MENKVTTITVKGSSPTVYVRLVHRPTGISVSGEGVVSRKLQKNLRMELDNRVRSYVRVYGHPPRVEVRKRYGYLR